VLQRRYPIFAGLWCLHIERLRGPILSEFFMVIDAACPRLRSLFLLVGFEDIEHSLPLSARSTVGLSHDSSTMSSFPRTIQTVQITVPTVIGLRKRSLPEWKGLVLSWLDHFAEYCVYSGPPTQLCCIWIILLCDTLESQPLLVAHHDVSLGEYGCAALEYGSPLPYSRCRHLRDEDFWLFDEPY
jgi:hypothetical protein